MRPGFIFQARSLLGIALCAAALSACKVQSDVEGAATISLAPDASVIQLGGAQQLSATVSPAGTAIGWSVEEPDAGTIDGGLYTPSGAGVFHVRATAEATPFPFAVSTVTVLPADGSPLIRSFDAAPAVVAPGAASDLTWQAFGATHEEIDPGPGDVTALSSAQVMPVATTTYTLTASNAAGTATATATVSVLLPPVIQSFTADPSSINLGQSATLGWSVQGATSMSIDNGVGDVSIQSAATVSPAFTTTYTLTAQNAAGTTSATVTVNVLQKPVIASFSISPSGINAGQSATASWSVQGATALSIDNGVGAVSGTQATLTPAQTTTYTLTATNAAGSSTATATVTVLQKPAFAMALTASPANIDVGQSSTLIFEVTGAATLTIDNGVGDVTGQISKLVAPAQTTTYTITATNAAGSATSSATVTVLQKPAINSFTAALSNINAGQSTTLSWSATGATSLSIDSGVGDVSGLGSKSVTPAQTTTYTLTAANAAGSVTATATVTVLQKPVIGSFVASSGNINAGQSSTLSWSAAGATSVSIDNGVGDVSGLSSKPVSPAQTTTYTLTATNAAGSATATATITVLQKPLIGTFAAATPNINVGQGTLLTWATSGATTVSIDSGVGVVTGQNSVGVTPAQTTTYTLSATNAAGTTTATATVTVLQKPAIGSFTSAQPNINVGQSTTLTWSISGAVSVSIDNSIGDVSALSSKLVTPAQTTTYTISATNAAGTSTATTTVSVLQKPVIGSFGASPSSIVAGQSTTLSWSVTGAASISIDNGVGDVTGLSSKSVSPAQNTTYTLTAQNAAATLTATTIVTVPPPAIAISPKSVSVTEGNTRQFIASVTGLVNTAATYAVQEGNGGSVSSSGLYTAPAVAGTFHVVATASGNTSLTDTATITVTDPGSYQTPGSVTGDVTVAIDSRTNQPISRYIYGLNFAEEGGPSFSQGGLWGNYMPSYTFSRFGGNRLSSESWETGYSNCGNDCGASFPNDTNLLYDIGADAGVGGATRPRIDRAFAADAGILLTASIIGYVAKDGTSTGINQPIPVAPDPNTPGAPSAAHWLTVGAHDPGGATATPSTTDGFVYNDDFAKWVDTSYPAGKSDPIKTIQFEMDNEPDYWGQTHEEIRGKTDAGTDSGLVGTGFDELITKTLTQAQAVKSVVPGALVWGGAFGGWDGLTQLNYNAHPNGPPSGYTYYLDYFLQQLKAAETNPSYGARMVDVLDVHWYTQDGNVTNDSDTTQSASVVDEREQSVRSLWDPYFIENTWVAGSVPTADSTHCVNGNCPLYAIPRLQKRISLYYPNTKLAIGEYWYGRGGDISGGIAQADALGIFARSGLFAATLWPNSSNIYAYYNPNNCAGASPSDTACTLTHAYVCALKAFDVYRNYDGAGARFGDTYLQTVPTDATYTSPATQNERVTAYASMDAGNPNRVVIVAINKSQTAALNTGLAVTHNVVFSTAQVWTMTGVNGNAGGCTGPTRGADISLTKVNAFNATIQPQTITIFVLTP